MILKPPSTDPIPTDPRLRAGVQAERQMAHYLHRASAASADLYVINDLRLVDPEQPEPDPRTGGSSPGVAQIDHLVLHRYGAFIVESKSVTGTVTVRDDGGGDEWTRGGRGFASPLRQAERQGEFLRAFLERHREQLVGTFGIGLKTLAKVVRGSDQRGFWAMPIQPIVAVSDQGKIERINGWTEPKRSFASFVLKADNVAGKIKDEYTKHRKAVVGQFTKPGVYGEYGFWAMKPEELGAVADFLVARHTPGTAPKQRTPEPAGPDNAESAPVKAKAEPKAKPTAQPEAPTPPTPPCPKCGKPTVLRYAKKGANAGQPFFGCPSFPKCRGVVAIAGEGKS
ncbi:MAG: NERD domain-containing protein [Phycisphaerales bacterium JB060]